MVTWGTIFDNHYAIGSTITHAVSEFDETMLPRASPEARQDRANDEISLDEPNRVGWHDDKDVVFHCFTVNFVENWQQQIKNR